jgi:formamidopyrimidine-DNA glycosylase
MNKHDRSKEKVFFGKSLVESLYPRTSLVINPEPENAEEEEKIYKLKNEICLDCSVEMFYNQDEKVFFCPNCKSTQ